MDPLKAARKEARRRADAEQEHMYVTSTAKHLGDYRVVSWGEMQRDIERHRRETVRCHGSEVGGEIHRSHRPHRCIHAECRPRPPREVRPAAAVELVVKEQLKLF